MYVCNLAPTDMVEYGHVFFARQGEGMVSQTFLFRCNTISTASARPRTTSRCDDARASRDVNLNR